MVRGAYHNRNGHFHDIAGIPYPGRLALRSCPPRRCFTVKSRPSDDPALTMTEVDKLFAAPLSRVADFVFDHDVAKVFPDMIKRSVPGYPTIVESIGLIAGQYAQPGSLIYDLGCSLGGASLAMNQQISHTDYTLHAVDNSEAMIRRFRKALEDEAEASGAFSDAASKTAVPGASEHPAGQREARSRINLQCCDIEDVEMENASVVVLNFTLQFIHPQKRDALMAKICQSLLPGGILVLSEKIRFPEMVLNELFIDMYHQFKQTQGYSELEVSQKRAALENVLIPESIDSHKQRLARAGFRSCDVWFQCFNFASLVAFR